MTPREPRSAVPVIRILSFGVIGEGRARLPDWCRRADAGQGSIWKACVGGIEVSASEPLARSGGGSCMDVFRVRDRLIDDYRDYTGSSVDIHDKNIREHVDERMAGGYQWPDPWLSLNPNFASGGTVTDLIAEGLLQPECEGSFRLTADNPAGPVLRLHQHQREAVEAARTGSSYVLTTGTGSGKSLAYIIPVVDRVLAAK